MSVCKMYLEVSVAKWTSSKLKMQGKIQNLKYKKKIDLMNSLGGGKEY